MHVISPVDILLINSELCNWTASASGANNLAMINKVGRMISPLFSEKMCRIRVAAAARARARWPTSPKYPSLGDVSCFTATSSPSTAKFLSLVFLL